MKTHTLETADADIVYDVQGPLPTADGRPTRPPLFMIGQPMDASGFRTLASYFPDRTVITYDPRGLGRSIRKDGRVDNVPTVQADDVHAVIRALGVGPVEMFASSGGAVTALALVAVYPNDVTVLVAHEPPLAAGASGRGGRRARPGPISGWVRGQGAGRRHGGLHRHDVMAGRVHRGILRTTGTGSRPVRDADRGRRLP